MREVNTPWYSSYNNIRCHLNYPDISLYQVIKDSCEKYPNNVCLYYFDKKIKYKEFYKEINDCAKSFKKLGIKYKDIVTICTPNMPEAIVCFYALNKIGAISNIVHPLSGENEIKKFINDTNSKYLVCVDLVYSKIQNIINETTIKKTIIIPINRSMPIVRKYMFNIKNKLKIKYNDKMLTWDSFIKFGKDYNKKINYKFSSSDIATILYSGGTTGIPKGIVHTNLSLTSIKESCVEFCKPLSTDDKTLAILPMFHGFGLSICIHIPLSIGASTVLVPKFDKDDFGKMIKKYKPNVLVGVPTLFEALLNAKDLENIDLSFIRCVLSGGDTLHPKLKRKVDKFLNDHNCKSSIREGYGLTESLSAVCISPMNTYKDNCIGIPCSDVYIKIVKPNTNKEVGYNEVGEIVISSNSVMKEYYNNKNETDMVIKKHSDGKTWLYTGDLGYMDEKGYVYFKQKIKRMIITSGYNVYPSYVESVIDDVPGVFEVCVVGVHHEYKMEVAKAFIVLDDKSADKDEIIDKIKEYCEKNLPKYSIPYYYEIVDELPKTNVGKIDYKKLEGRCKL